MDHQRRARPPPKPRRSPSSRSGPSRAPPLLLLLLALGLLLSLLPPLASCTYGVEYYDDDGYGYDEFDDDGYLEGEGEEDQQPAYYVVDLDPTAPSNAIQREYMRCFLPFNAPPAPPAAADGGGGEDGAAAAAGAEEGQWRAVDPGMQVTLDLNCLLASVPEGALDGAPASQRKRALLRGAEARLPLLRVGEEYACERASTASATTTCYGRFAPLLLEAAFSRSNGYYRFSAQQMDLQDDLLDLCAYYTDGQDYDDCLASFYDWQALTDQFTRSPDPLKKPRRFAERRELREEVIFRLYLETPEFVAGDLYARLDEARLADLAAMDREVNGDGGGGTEMGKEGGRRRRKVLVDGAGRVMPDVDPESVVLPGAPRRVAAGGGRGRGGEEGDEEGGDVDLEGEEELMTAAEAAELAGWDEEGADPRDTVYFHRNLHPLPPGAHRWWPPPPPPPPGAAFGGAVPPPLLGGEEAEEPPHGPEEEQLLMTKILKDVFAETPPQGEAPPRLEDPFEPKFDDSWDDGAGGYYDDYAQGGGGDGYDEAMVTGVSPTGMLEPIGDEVLDEYYWTDVTQMPPNVTETL